MEGRWRPWWAVGGGTAAAAARRLPCSLSLSLPLRGRAARAVRQLARPTQGLRGGVEDATAGGWGLPASQWSYRLPGRCFYEEQCESGRRARSRVRFFFFCLSPPHFFFLPLHFSRLPRWHAPSGYVPPPRRPHTCLRRLTASPSLHATRGGGSSPTRPARLKAAQRCRARPPPPTRLSHSRAHTHQPTLPTHTHTAQEADARPGRPRSGQGTQDLCVLAGAARGAFLCFCLSFTTCVRAPSRHHHQNSLFSPTLSQPTKTHAAPHEAAGGRPAPHDVAQHGHPAQGEGRMREETEG
jgi:hypothetical protein